MNALAGYRYVRVTAFDRACYGNGYDIKKLISMKITNFTFYLNQF